MICKKKEFEIVKSKTDGTLKNCLQKFIERYSTITKKLMVDSGEEFDNMILRRYCKDRGSALQFGSSKDHKTTGVIERAINTYINKLVKWPKIKPISEKIW